MGGVSFSGVTGSISLSLDTSDPSKLRARDVRFIQRPVSLAFGDEREPCADAYTDCVIW
jgi:hypothetical protein